MAKEFSKIYGFRICLAKSTGSGFDPGPKYEIKFTFPCIAILKLFMKCQFGHADDFLRRLIFLKLCKTHKKLNVLNRKFAT